MSDFITKADLLESESKITKEEQRIRHNLKNEIHLDYLKIDEKAGNNEKELALLKQSQATMSENIKEIKKDMKEGFANLEGKMEDFFNNLPEHFATKAEHKENSIKICEIVEKQKKWDSRAWWLIGLLIAGIVTAIFNVILK